MITVNFWLPLILHLTPRHHPNTLEYRGIIEQNICKIQTLLLLHCDVKIISKRVIEIWVFPIIIMYKMYRDKFIYQDKCYDYYRDTNFVIAQP